MKLKIAAANNDLKVEFSNSEKWLEAVNLLGFTTGYPDEPADVTDQYTSDEWDPEKYHADEIVDYINYVDMWYAFLGDDVVGFWSTESTEKVYGFNEYGTLLDDFDPAKIRAFKRILKLHNLLG